MNPYQMQQAGVGVGSRESVQPETPPSPSLIRDSLTEAEGRLANLHAMISHLESRLDTILTPQPPATATGSMPKEQAPPASHTLDRARQLYYGIGEAGDRLRALMNRVEI